MGAERMIYGERGGNSGPVLVLLHGLGANGTVWDGMRPLIAGQWPGRWLIPDLRGHGRSFHGAPYGFGIHAADVAALIEPGAETVVVGHSMGGVVALTLATGLFGVNVKKAVAFGVKSRWSDDDYAKAEAVAAMPVKYLDSEAEAIDRYLKVSGLKGLVDPGSPAARLGVRAENGKFRLAVDPLTNGLGRADFAALATMIKSPVKLLSGEKDPIGSAADMGAVWGGEVAVLPGLGHNCHVEAPETLWKAMGLI